MTEETAKLVINICFYVGVAVWLLTVRLFGKMLRASSIQQFDGTLRGATPGDAMPRLIAALQSSSAAATGLALPGMRLARTDESRLEVTLPTAAVAFESERRGNDAFLSAIVDTSRYDRIMRIVMGAMTLVVVPVVIAGAAMLLKAYVAPNINPAVRWQCVQIVQTVHVLWPPFLVYFLWKRIHNASRDATSNLLVSLEAGG